MAAGDPIDCRAVLLRLVREREQGAHVHELESQPPGVTDEGEPLEMLRAVVPIIAPGPRRLGKEVDTLVLADRLRVEAGAGGEFADLHSGA